MSRLKNKVIGITMGDPFGIGPEITAKALGKASINRIANFKIIGDYTLFEKYAKRIPKSCDFIDVRHIQAGQLQMGKISRTSGEASLKYIQVAVQLLKKKQINALVTAPVCKEAIKMTDPMFQGHTEFLANAVKSKKVGMFFVAGKYKLIIATRHIPVNAISSTLTIKNIFEAINLTHMALTKLFGLKNPAIAVLGLNPHAGEGGKIGKEEQKCIIPAIKKSRKKGINALGPFPADTLFSFDFTNKYDAIVAMYHDQGLIPIKTLCFKNLVNLTLGLPFIRTSPAHGTAFDIAGKGMADPDPMCAAIRLANQLSR